MRMNDEEQGGVECKGEHVSEAVYRRDEWEQLWTQDEAPATSCAAKQRRQGDDCATSRREFKVFAENTQMRRAVP